MPMPERTCIACRRREARWALLRFGADGRGHLRLDALQRMPGRGVYVCPRQRCIAAASRASGFARSLRRGVAVADPFEVTRAAKEEIRAQVVRLRENALQDGRAARGTGGEVQVLERRLRQRLDVLEEQSRCLESSGD